MNARKARAAANRIMKTIYKENKNVFSKPVFHKNNQLGGKMKFKNRSQIILFLKNSFESHHEDLIPN